MTQPAIAQKVGVDQSTISLYSKRFGERAAEIGLLEAAKEFNVYKEVSELRNLSVELQKYNLTAEDAREGIGIIKAFSKLGVTTDQHIKLIQVCKNINDQGFINASLELVRTEEKAVRIATGLGWGHEDCLKTFLGRMKQLALVGEYIPKIEEKSSPQKGAEAGKPTVPTLRLNI